MTESNIVNASVLGSDIERNKTSMELLYEMQQSIAQDEIDTEGEDAPALSIDEIRALVPWRVSEDKWKPDTFHHGINDWMDDHGVYPRAFRSYTKEEWAEAIKIIADTVRALYIDRTEYQHKHGLYVEEQTDTFLLVRGKKWQLMIQVPSKVSASTKRIQLTMDDGRQAYYHDERELTRKFAELLMSYVPVEDQNFILDICCQYLPGLRLHVNKAVWASQNPDVAGFILEER